MSNIANQVVAVAATLLGFVAHAALSERDVPAASVAVATLSSAVDPIVTRGIALDGMPVEEWLSVSPRAKHAALPAPAARISDRTAATRPSLHRETEFAGVRVNETRYAPRSHDADVTFLR
jgi:hypothetical protein